MIELLHSMLEALGSNPSTTRKKKKTWAIWEGTSFGENITRFFSLDALS